jgi:hypothetical protein
LVVLWARLTRQTKPLAAMQPLCDISPCRSGSCLPAFCQTQSYDRVIL